MTSPTDQIVEALKDGLQYVHDYALHRLEIDHPHYDFDRLLAVEAAVRMNTCIEQLTGAPDPEAESMPWLPERQHAAAAAWLTEAGLRPPGWKPAEDRPSGLVMSSGAPSPARPDGTPAPPVFGWADLPSGAESASESPAAPAGGTRPSAPSGGADSASERRRRQDSAAADQIRTRFAIAADHLGAGRYLTDGLWEFGKVRTLEVPELEGGVRHVQAKPYGHEIGNARGGRIEATYWQEEQP